MYTKKNIVYIGGIKLHLLLKNNSFLVEPRRLIGDLVAIPLLTSSSSMTMLRELSEDTGYSA
jgi:hypothetical protein